MSRIHDALKKAELEQSASSGNGTPLRAAGIATQVEAVADPEFAPAAAPSFPAPLSLDALQERTTAQGWNPDVTMLFFQPTATAALETFRTLRSRLSQVREKTACQKLLIASSMGNEGKSFVAANLAQALAQQEGQRVLLIDGDLRTGKLHVPLGAPSEPGLADYFMGNVEELAVIQRGPMENLYFIPAGKIASNPLELIANGRMKTLLGRIESLFDWIIVDSCPAVAVSDAGMMANYCDALLLVVRSEATPYDVAKKARDEFYGKKIVGVVLNGVGAKTG